MKHISINFLIKHPLLMITALTSLLIVSNLALATEDQSISCENGHNGDKRIIIIERVNSANKACRTLYSTGGGPFKEVAWALGTPQKCEQAANHLATILSNAGLHCVTNNISLTFTKPTLKKPHLKLSKRTTSPSSNEDLKLLESIIK